MQEKIRDLARVFLHCVEKYILPKIKFTFFHSFRLMKTRPQFYSFHQKFNIENN